MCSYGYTVTQLSTWDYIIIAVFGTGRYYRTYTIYRFDPKIMDFEVELEVGEKNEKKS